MAEKRQHHFVTAGYLRNFLMPGTDKLNVYSRKRKNRFGARPDTIARKRDYYAFHKPDGSRDNAIEDLFADEIEGPGLLSLRRLLCGKQLTRDQRGRVALLLSAQEFRVPWFREQIERTQGEMLEQLGKFSTTIPGYLERTLKEIGHGDVDPDEIRRGIMEDQYKIEVHPEASLPTILSMLTDMAEIYAGMRWHVLTAPSGSFPTSDCPVVRIYPGLKAGERALGLADKRVHIVFPLSHSRAMAITQDHEKVEKFDDLMKRGRKREALRLRGRSSDVTYRAISQKHATEVATAIAQRAEDFVFTSEMGPDPLAWLDGESKNLRMELKHHKVGNLFEINLQPPREDQPHINWLGEEGLKLRK